jgi:hypothetical protein
LPEGIPEGFKMAPDLFDDGSLDLKETGRLQGLEIFCAPVDGMVDQ